MNTISAVIITYNESLNIGRCIKSLKAVVDEIIVVDSYSSDPTEAISRAEGVLFYKKKFIGYADQKNYALSLAKSSYILSLDADEFLSQELTKALQNRKQNLNHGGYTMNRLSSYAGTYVRSCGWYPDCKIRMCKNGNGIWIGQGIHEKMQLKEDVSLGHLKGDILHNSYRNLAHVIEKTQRYSDIYANEWAFKKKCSGFKVFYKTTFSFVKSYFFRKGFLEGYTGFLISVCNASHTFYKYAKLKEYNNMLGVSLIITTYNRKNALELVLMSLLEQSRMPQEIIIADDGSREDTKEMIDAYKKKISIPIRHCWHQDDGFRAGQIRNKAMAISTYPYIIMIDGDLIMHRHFIKNHIKKSHKKKFIQGSRVVLNRKLTRRKIKKKEITVSLFSSGIKNRLNALYAPVFFSIYTLLFSNRKTRGSVHSANMSFWKEDILAVNGFDENFVGWGYEDSDFANRLCTSGVSYKRLKFIGFGYHLFHTSRLEETTRKNNEMRYHSRDKKLVYCQNGIDKYMPNNKQ